MTLFDEKAIQCMVILFCMIFVRASTGHSAIWYVDSSRPDNNGIATNWATAKKTIQAAVDVASDNDTVLVTNGVYATGGRVTPGYSLTNRVVITNDIALRSVNGPDETIIQGNGQMGGAVVRCVFMNGGVLDGFTLTNGYTLGNGDLAFDQSGGGAYIVNTSITNCTLSGNASHYQGGGAFGGSLYNCTLSGNSVVIGETDGRSGYGGGAASGTLYNCVLSGNWAYGHNDSSYGGDGIGGGAFGATLYNCTLSGNVAQGGRNYVLGTQGGARGGRGLGGGASECTLYNCMLSNNAANGGYGIYSGGGNASGGAVDDSLLYNCILNDNSASGAVGGHSAGGGAAGGTLNNCTVIRNRATSGGGAIIGTLNNCTLTQNFAATSGGGTESCELKNCIVFYNTATSGSNSSFDYLNFCCTTPDPGGTGNITNEPGFVSTNDLHLMANSPCLDAGTNLTEITTDIEGISRPLDGNEDGVAQCDMGAYEYVNTNATADPDVDGMDNSQEQIAGTDPLNPLSVFAIESIINVSNSVVLSWPSCTGRLYSVYASTNLLTEPVWDLTDITNTPGYGEILKYTNFNDGPRYFQVRVRRP